MFCTNLTLPPRYAKYAEGLVSDPFTADNYSSLSAKISIVNVNGTTSIIRFLTIQEILSLIIPHLAKVLTM